jgi:8-oxo-dGTP pyrophosphatase MutT (NUDIX family)
MIHITSTIHQEGGLEHGSRPDRSLHNVVEFPEYKREWKATADALLENRPYGSVRHRVVADERGKPLFDFPQFIEPGGVAILPISNTDEIGLLLVERPAMLKQLPKGNYPDYRVPDDFGRQVWEAPRGYCELGEDPEDAARRELREETQLEAFELRGVGEINCNSAILATPISLFAARITNVAGFTGPQSSEGHKELRFFALDELYSLLDNGALVCAITMALLFRASMLGWLRRGEMSPPEHASQAKALQK